MTDTHEHLERVSEALRRLGSTADDVPLSFSSIALLLQLAELAKRQEAFYSKLLEDIDHLRGRLEELESR